MGSPSTRCKSEERSILIVEGVDDCHAIYHLAQKNKCEETFGIYEGGSDEGALNHFGGLLVATPNRKPTFMGIVLDCDEGSIQDRWAQIQAKLSPSGYVVPKTPQVEGTLVRPPSDGMPTVGVWLMPDNQNAGALEEFLSRLAPTGAVDYARECARAARQKNYGNYKDAHESKAVIHTYLAWQDVPGKRLGEAISAGLFDANAELAHRFIQWLKQLFPETNSAHAHL